jgi:hypothetical protein
MDTNSAIFQQILVKLRAFEAQGLRYRVVAPDGQEFASAAPFEPTKVVKRVNINRSIVISDIVNTQQARQRDNREELEQRRVGDGLSNFRQRRVRGCAGARWRRTDALEIT